MCKIWMLITVCALSIPCIAQSMSQKVSLELGSVTVWLGMPRQEVINKCASVGFKQLVQDRDRLRFQSEDHMYTTEFKNGRLVYADRDWYSKKSGSDAFQSTIAALGTIGDKNTTCIISHAPVTDPDKMLNRVFIECGKRSFLLLENKTEGKAYYDVYERIGEMLPTTK